MKSGFSSKHILGCLEEDDIKEGTVVDWGNGRTATVIHIYKRKKDVCVLELDDGTVTDKRISELKKVRL